MVGIYDTEAADVIGKAAQELKKTKVQAPEWAAFVKTGVCKERLPDDPDWWYMRAGSMLRKIYMRGPVGVSSLRKYYGCKKNRGVKPGKFRLASGKIIRTILQQLEAEGLVVQVEKGVHKGRIMSPKGKSFMDKLVVRNVGRVKKEKAGADAKPAAE